MVALDSVAQGGGTVSKNGRGQPIDGVVNNMMEARIAMLIPDEYRAEDGGKVRVDS